MYSKLVKYRIKNYKYTKPKLRTKLKHNQNINTRNSVKKFDFGSLIAHIYT